MKRIFRIILVFAVVTVGVLAQADLKTRVGRVENGLLPPVLIKGDPEMNILERLKFYKIPGVSVAVISDYKIAWAKGYGVMDVETKEPVTEKTLFVAGSVSKPVAAMGVLRLVQEGKLSLDENINTYLRSWKLPENELTKVKKVTPRGLLTHSAGTTVHGFRGYAPGEAVPTLKQVLDGEPPANSAPIRVDLEPGKQWRYSGGGTTIMQQALMDIEKKPFPDILHEKVLAPLEMRSSSYEQTFAPERLKFAASGHKAESRLIEGKRFIYPEMAAAGLWTTPSDLARLAIEVQLSIEGKSNKVLSKEMARLMVTPHIKVSDEGDMAIGFFLEKNDRYFGHGGADEGFICALLASVEGGYGVAVMTNSDSRSGELIGEIMRGVAKEYGWKDYLPDPVEIISLDPEKLQPLAGRYLLSSDNILTVKLEGGKILGEEIDSPRFELLPVSPTEFVRRDRDIRYIFAGSEGVTLRRGRREEKAPRAAAGIKVPLELMLKGDFEQAAKLYRQIRAKNMKDPAVDESRLNGLGYQFMQKKLYDAAVAVFKLNVEFYPGSWNVYDSLAEAYLTKGEKELAIKNYEKSLRLNPQNANGAKKLEKLRKE